MNIIHDVTRRGDVKELRRILAADPAFRLADPKFTCFRRTPLHEAAMLNHVEFVSVIVDKDPQLAMDVDSQGFTPLHLATARNNVEMVRMLLNANTDACLVQDGDGRTPLHLAAMRNEVRIMEWLVQSRPEAIQRKLLDTDETILHLCVKHDKFIAMKKLVDYMVTNRDALANSQDIISVNSIDSNGNTILHLAAQLKQTKMLKYLIQSDDIGIDINIRNDEGVKALHMLDRKEMEEIGISCYDYHTTTELPQQDREVLKQSTSSKNEWLKERMNTIMIVAALIAGIAFQAVINPPGGVFQEDSKIKSTEDPDIFIYYLSRVLDYPTMSEGFESYYSHRVDDLPTQKTTGGNITVDDIIAYRANFVQGLLGAAETSRYGSRFPYELAPGIVLDDNWWMNITSNYNSTIGGGSGFSPYLIHYAGTSILAYRSPYIYESYILFNSVSLVVCGITILVVTFDAIKQRRSGGSSAASLVGFLEVLLATAVACTGLSYTIVLQTIGPPFYVVGTIKSELLAFLPVVIFAPLGTFIFLHLSSRFLKWALGHPFFKRFSWARSSGLHDLIWLLIKMILFCVALWFFSIIIIH